MSNYTGYISRTFSDEALEKLYSGGYSAADFNLLTNQYLIVEDLEGNVVDRFVCKSDKLEKMPFHTIESVALGKIKPRNVEQQLAFHMLQDPDSKIKLLSGCFGSGKSLSILAQVLSDLQRGKFEKMVFVRNNIAVKNTTELGALPGTEREKLFPFLMPLADHLGGVDALNRYLDEGKIEPIHLGYLRGRDLRNCAIVVQEGQNLTVEHTKLLIGRVGEGSTLFIDGDQHAQVDKDVFDKYSGMNALIEKLSGNPYFAYVHLKKSERSPVAALADLLD